MTKKKDRKSDLKKGKKLQWDFLMGFLNTVTRLSFDLYEGKMHFRFVLFIWYFTKQANDGNKNSIFCKICQHYCNNSELWIVHRQFTICVVVLFWVSFLLLMKLLTVVKVIWAAAENGACHLQLCIVSTLLDSSKRFNLFYETYKVDISSIEMLKTLH